MSIKQFNKVKQFSKQTNPKFNLEDEDEGFKPLVPQLGYFRKVQTAQCIQIAIDEEIKEASYYRQVAQAIRDTSEGDIIEFDICSPGGRLEGLQVLLSAIYSTEADTIAKINGDCSSAASMLALHCDGVVVSPFATMLVHNVSYSTGHSKNADIKNLVEHISEYSEKLFRETYQYFLTEDEIVRCLDGYQLYLNADEISERLKIKFEKMKEEQDELEGSCDCYSKVEYCDPMPQVSLEFPILDDIQEVPEKAPKNKKK